MWKWVGDPTKNTRLTSSLDNIYKHKTRCKAFLAGSAKIYIFWWILGVPKKGILVGWLGKVGNGGGGEKWRGKEEEKGKRAKGKRGEGGKCIKLVLFSEMGKRGNRTLHLVLTTTGSCCLLQGFCCCALNSNWLRLNSKKLSLLGLNFQPTNLHISALETIPIVPRPTFSYEKTAK